MFEEKESFWQKKGFYFSACILLIGVMAVGAICYRQANKQGDEKMMADIATEVPQATQKEDTSIKKEEAKAANAQVQQEKETDPPSDKKEIKQNTSASKQNTSEENVKKKETTKKSTKASKKVRKTSAQVKRNALSFNEESGLLWPVEGDVLLKYSMTNTVFFKTLAQYKCNAGIMIGAKEGTEVKAASDCRITKITKTDEFGTMITTDIGDKYTVTYGQLDHVKVKKGDMVEEGEIIATVAKPTKYYTEEGSNLYLQVKEGKSTVDPLFLLR